MSTEVRDKLAAEQGWTKGQGDVWEKGAIRIFHHPIPDDLNTCAAMWDKYASDDAGDGTGGWELYRGWSRRPWESTGRLAWSAEKRDESHPMVKVYVSGTDAASELRDRWALLGEVLKARGV